MKLSPTVAFSAQNRPVTKSQVKQASTEVATDQVNISDPVKAPHNKNIANLYAATGTVAGAGVGYAAGQLLSLSPVLSGIVAGGTLAVVGAVAGGLAGAIKLGPKLGGGGHTSGIGGALAGAAIGAVVGGGVGLGLGSLAGAYLPVVTTTTLGTASGFIMASRMYEKNHEIA